MLFQKLMGAVASNPLFIASSTFQSTLAAGTTNVTLTRPASANIGDLMIVALAAGNTANTRTWTGPAGWTEVADQNAFPCLAIYYKTYLSGDSSTYTFSVNLGTSSGLSGGMVVYRNAAYSGIGSITTNTNPLVIPGIDVVKNNSILLAIGARNAASVTMGTPSGMTVRAIDNDATPPSFIICDQAVNSGLTGTRSMTSGATTGVAGVLVEIN